MRTFNWSFLLSWWVFVAALTCFLNPVSAGVDAARVSSDRFFVSTNLQTFEVELGEVEWQELARSPKTYVAGKVRVGEKVYEHVGIRLKGTGTFQPISMHPSLALKFNWHVPNQEFAGLNKLYLNNSGQDATYLCEMIASGAFANANLAVPRITQARVRLNRRDLGLCVVAEPVNKKFLKQHFGDSRGFLYEGEFRDIRSHLEQDNGLPSDQSDLRQLYFAAIQPTAEKRRLALGQLLDIDQFLDFLAVEMIVANWDGYAYHQNNYRIYHDPGSNCMVLIPHGLDNTFFESGLSLMPQRNGILVKALLSTAEEQEAFRERVARLLPGVLNPSAIAEQLRGGELRMTQGLDPVEAVGIHQRTELFEQRVQERASHLLAELAGVKPATPVFDARGIAQLEGWQAKPDWNHSPLEVLPSATRRYLSVQATNGFCFGSWRLPVWLPPGSYRLEGASRTSDVAGLPSRTGSGAGVRVLGNSRGSGLQGSTEWAQVQHDFVVQPGCEWIELVAELRAFRGSAWFDPGALRLVHKLEKSGI